MQRDPRAYLWDAQEAACAIQSFIANLDFEAYAANALVYSAVERKFEIIGEALRLLAKADPALAVRIPHLPEIIAFRNLLVHGYSVVDPLRVWRIANGPLLALRATVVDILNELGPA